MQVGRVWEVPENVYRDGRLAFAVGEVLDYDVAVREGLVAHEDERPEPPKGKRKGGGRARRPAEDRARRLEDDRAGE